MQSAIKHLHAFVSEVRPTGAEWFKAIEFLTAIGQKCDDKRQEFILLSDTHGRLACWWTTSTTAASPARRRARSKARSTFRTRRKSPTAPDMASSAPGIPCFVTGTVRGLDGKPIAGAVLDLWQTDGEGLYEEQRRTAEPWMRGIYQSQADGSYSIRTVAPISYTIPMDGPVGEFFSRTNMSHMRPAHIHFAVSAPGYHYLVTHLFQKGDEYIDNDVVYGVKDAADRRVREEAARQGAERRDGRHAVLRGEVRLRAGSRSRRRSPRRNSHAELPLSAGDTRVPPFRADHVGSLLRPAALKEAREKRARGEIDAAALTAIEDREIKALIARQEAVGLKSITDGEYRRASWQTDFLRERSTASRHSSATARSSSRAGAQPKQWVSRVKEKLGRFSGHPQIAHWKFVADHTRQTAKVTIPSPSALHFRQGRAAVPEAIYPDMEDFYRDLGALYAKVVRGFADAGCRYLQLDEVNLAYLCDPSLREHVKARGDDPDTLPLTYAGMINAAMADIPADMTITMHLCRGNFRSTFVASGGYEPVAEILFNTIKVHGYFMEYDSRARRRVRAAALPAEGQDRGARARHLEDRAA